VGTDFCQYVSLYTMISMALEDRVNKLKHEGMCTNKTYANRNLNLEFRQFGYVNSFYIQVSFFVITIISIISSELLSVFVLYFLMNASYNIKHNTKTQIIMTAPTKTHPDAK